MLTLVLALATQNKTLPSHGILPLDGQIQTSMKLNGGRATRPVADGQAAFNITQDGVTIDFNGALVTSSRTANPALENLQGIGLLIRGRKHVTIRNARISGFRFNIVIQDCEDVTLDHCLVGGSRSELISPPKWLTLRDINEWRTYGAGIWMERDTNCLVNRCEASGGQNGILLVDSDQNVVTNNDFSFNSGWGAGLWHSSRNTLSWNHMDFVNRPWGAGSNGGFGWGGDSAALSLANGCDENLIVGNSLTHSGDGFFLTDRVNGGYDEKTHTFNFSGASNRNLIAYNDGSFASANAFEGTFSNGNVYYRNKANRSEYGFWIGFSNDTVLLENEASFNHRDGIAGGQGSRSRIEGNVLRENGGHAVDLWSDPGAADAQAPATNHWLFKNTVSGEQAYQFRRSTGVVTALEGTVELHGSVDPEIPTPAQREAFEGSARWQLIERVKQSRPAGWTYYGEGPLAIGPEWIAAGTYAPIDFRRKLAAVCSPDPGSVELYLNQDGVQVDAPSSLRFADTHTNPHIVRLEAPPAANGMGGELPYVIRLVSADKKRTETVSGTLSTALWNLKWYRWDVPTLLKYDDIDGWNALFNSAPLAVGTAKSLDADYTGRSPTPGIPVEHFALLAVTRLTLAGGTYTFETVSDDGIRLYVDGKLLIDRWNHHGATPDRAEAAVSAGNHAIKVLYCQEDGGATLHVAWHRKP